MTNEDLPEEVKQRMEIMEYFRHLEPAPADEGLDVELTGDWKTHKI